jgi:hypothetical protein
LNNIGAALFNAYIYQPFENPDGAHMVQQEEQQQQSRSDKWQVTSDKQNNSPITYHSLLFL